MTDKQKKALEVFFQSLITAALLLLQSLFFPSCISAGGDVNQTNDISIPVTIPLSSEVYND